jgi:aminopeptidase-like protein
MIAQFGATQSLSKDREQLRNARLALTAGCLGDSMGFP